MVARIEFGQARFLDDMSHPFHHHQRLRESDGRSTADGCMGFIDRWPTGPICARTSPGSGRGSRACTLTSRPPVGLSSMNT